tara:strand:+ start:60 stop:665 length:606 start_codon:yes stop_codon:yes gene_type:complete
MEVQAHGNKFEDIVTRERTGLSKKEYDGLKKNGYTSSFDLSKGLKVDYNASIKTTGNNTICCSDILRMMKHNDYRLIVGCYNQVGDQKIFHTQYEFFIQPNDYLTLWGDMDFQRVELFVNYVKSIPEGAEARDNSKIVRDSLQESASCNKALYSINPKVDSKKQRRVQCSLKLDELLASGVEYEKKDLNLIIESKKRTFNK